MIETLHLDECDDCCSDKNVGGIYRNEGLVLRETKRYEWHFASLVCDLCLLMTVISSTML